MWNDRTTRYSARVEVDRPTAVLLVALFAVFTPSLIDGWQSGEKTDPIKHVLALDPRWALALEAAPAAPAGFDEQSAYVSLKSGQLVAVGLDHGDLRWKVDVATALSPATGDGLVFAGGDDFVAAFEDRTGKPVWRTAIGGSLAVPVYFDAGAIVVAKSDGELLLLASQDGQIIWRRTLAAPVALRPSAAGDRVYAGLKDGSIVAVDRDTGSDIWTQALGVAITGLLALDEQVVVGTRGNRVYSLSVDKGRRRWAWPRVGGDVSGTPAADDHHIYFAALDNVLRALSRTNGNLQWSQPLPSRPVGGPVLTGDVVIMPTVSADIGAYSAKTGKPAFTIKAAGEVGGVPFVREMSRPTAPRLIAISREGTLQGFAPRYEPPLAALDTVPGMKVGG